MRAAVAEGDAGDRRQVAVAPRVTVAAGVACGFAPDLGQPLLAARVRREPVHALRRGAPLGAREVGGEQLLALQHADDVDHALRVVGVAREIFGAQAVGLQLLVTAVRRQIAGGSDLRDLAREIGRAAEALPFEYRAEHGRGEHPEPGLLLPRRALRAVARGDMADLVPEHAGELGLAAQVREDAARDVDIAARQREGVDLGAVEHGEGPRQLRAVRLARQPLADLAHVGLQSRVVDATVLLHDLRVRLAPLGDLVGLGHDRALGLAGDRVDDRRAAAGQQQRGGQRRRAGGEAAAHPRGPGPACRQVVSAHRFRLFRHGSAPREVGRMPPAIAPAGSGRWPSRRRRIPASRARAGASARWSGTPASGSR